MRYSETQQRKREATEEEERSNMLIYGGLLDIDEIMAVAGFSQDMREWVLEGRGSRDCSMNIEIPGKTSSRVISWLQLRENTDRYNMLDRLTCVPGYIVRGRMSDMRNERDLKTWTDAISYLKPMLILLDVECERDHEWYEREM